MTPRLQNFIDRLSRGEMLLSDGAWATELQKLGLAAGDCPEAWNLSRSDDVREIAKKYFDAGADFCLTNTFGGNRFRLVRHGYADALAEINRRGAQLSREGSLNGDGVVFGSVGPTGEYVQPEGMLTQNEMLAAYREQMAALKDGGVDAICVETMYVLDEAALAIRAARELGLYCMASVTFDQTPHGFQTMMGSNVEEATRALDVAGAEIVGANCGNGIDDMVKIARQMRGFTKKPLGIRSNAGIPDMVDGKAHYRETPELMAGRLRELREIGVQIVGGCCGTTPKHISAMRSEIRRLGAAGS